MSSSSHPLTEAQAAFRRIEPLLPPATSVAIQQRLAEWQRQLNQQQHSTVALPELVMRPNLPPRPLNKHYFTVIRSYE